jgi:hypothetical protein
MPWGVAAAVGGAVVGGVASNMAADTAADGQVEAAKMANSPWEKAQPYILDGYDQAKTELNNNLTGAYTGPRVAGLDPYQTNGATATGDWASTYGSQIPTQLFNGGTSMMNSGSAYGTNAQNIINQAGTDQTQNFLSQANQYANNPYVNGLIDANSRDIVRNLNENQLPSLNLAAAGTGNTNSTRTGVSQAIAERGAADRLADVSNNIRSSFFNNGLNMAQSQYNTQQSLASNTNQQLGQAYQLGTGSLTGAQQANGNNFDQTQAAGGVFQGQQQKEYDAAKAAYGEGQNTNLDLLAKYMGIINGAYGGSGVPGTVSNGAAAGIQGALGGAATGAGLYGKLGGFNNTTSTPMPGLEGGYNNVTGAGAFDSVDAYG